jgi:hypothetical protein
MQAFPSLGGDLYHTYQRRQSEAERTTPQPPFSVQREKDHISLLSPSLINELNQKLSISFVDKRSSSLLMIGNQYESKRYIRQSVIEICEKNSFSPVVSEEILVNSCFSIDGEFFHESDHESFINLCDQCLNNSRKQQFSYENSFLNHRDKNLSSLLEDFENFLHFRQIEELPVIFLIENFHYYTKPKRQTFIYTLLDLIHKNELFFIVSHYFLSSLFRSLLSFYKGDWINSSD